MGKKRIGVIDLGTNTFNLLIADVSTEEMEVVHSEKDGVALGMGGLNDGVLRKEAILRALKTLSHFNKMCEVHYVDEIRAFGTSAIRSAINGKDFVQLVAKETGIEVKIISGEDEARLIYEGVKWSYIFEEPTMIMDVGGGSSEFIFANKDEIIDLVSLNIGVSRIFQELELSDPFTNDDIDKVTQWLEERASTFLANKKCNVLVGASGCFETFYEMINRKSFPSVKNAIELPFDELMNNLEWIIGSDQIQRDLHPHIIPIRRKMAAIAAVKTNWIIEKLGVNKVIVSPCSLKEGVLQVAADF
jgi:exopolyphosphatase/guanosine-5'-triphosphate,3'-diphosphate pyrophosphatase